MQLKHPTAVRTATMLRDALRIAPVRPNYAAGVRAGIATTFPLLLLGLTGMAGLTWTSLAGFNSVLVDKGGAYRTRALSIFSLALSGSFVVTLGSLAAKHPWAAVPLVLAVVFAGGFARLFGAEATSVGVTTSVAFVVALTRPAPDFVSALAAGGFFLLGSLWAAFISLVLWPLRPYRPASEAIALSLRALSEVATSFVGADCTSEAQVRRREQLGHTRRMIELARRAIGASRRGRPGPSRRGEQLVALLEAADLLFAALVALEDGLALEPDPDLPELPRWLDAAARHMASELLRIAAAVADEKAPPASPSARPSFTQITLALEPHVQATNEYVPRVLARAIERLDYVSELAQQLGLSRRPAAAAPLVTRASRTEPSDLSTDASKLSLIRDNLTLDSAMFRHALRMAISTAVAASATHAIELSYGYWATLTCLVILQPYGSETWAKALQRVAGTILGAGVALLVASLVHAPAVITVFVFAFVATGMALLPLNYAAFAVFLTPAFVLLAETRTGQLDLSGVRVLNTLLGAGIALLGSRLLFPLSERDAFRPLMSEAFGALRALLAVAAAEQPAAARLGAARRRLGLALLNAEASYQRLLTESGIAPAESEAVLTLLLYAHRLASGLIALAVAEGTLAHGRLRERQPLLDAELLELRESLLQRRPPRAADHAESSALDHGERVEVLFEQLAVLRAAATRWDAARVMTPRGRGGALLRE
ncbi:MAG: hypothetical protein JWN48_6117 [Myxococcaceae bacterium]|nr:hypothetical protein [Myxococcaceae bacterium]